MGVGRNLAIGASVIAIVGAGGYLAWAYYFKPKMDAKAKKPGSVPGSTGAGTTSNTGNTGIKPPSVTPVVVPPGKLTPVVVPPPASMPFSNVDDIKAFQNWLDVMHPTWVNGGRLNKDKGNGYGSFGPSTSAAYSAFKQEYCDITGICPTGVVRNKQTTPGNSSKKGGKSHDMALLKKFLKKWQQIQFQGNKTFKVMTKDSAPRVFVSFYDNGLVVIDKQYKENYPAVKEIKGEWGFWGGYLIITIQNVDYSIATGGDGLWDLLKTLNYVSANGDFIPFEGEGTSEKQAPKTTTKTAKNSPSSKVTNELCNVNDGCTLDDSGTPRVFTLG